MTWDFYISASKLVTKHTLLATQEKMKASVTQRRELLKKPTDSKEYKSYGAYVASMTKWKKNTKQWMQMTLFQSLNVPKTVFLNSIKTYLSDPEKRKEYDTTMNQYKQEISPSEHKALEKDVVLDAVRYLEEQRLKKVEVCVKMLASKAPMNAIYAVLKIQNMVNEDRLANEKGVEVSDVKHNIKEQGLKEDEEFKAIIDEFTTKKAEITDGLDA